MIFRKLILEIIEPHIPKKVGYSTPTLKKGTIHERKVNKVSFKTSKGNKVDIYIEKKYNEGYFEIRFFVNDKMETESNLFDIEVLKGVFTLLPKIADKFDIQELHIESYSDANDIKYAKNLDYSKYIPELLKKCEEVSAEIANKIRLLDEDKRFIYMQDQRRIISFTEYMKTKDKQYWDVKIIEDLVRMRIFDDLNNLYRKFRHAYISNTEEGAPIFRNRRHEIYGRLLPKYMAKFDITEDKDFSSKGYVLTRKKFTDLNEEEDYRGENSAPSKDSGAPLYKMTVLYPDDIYGHNALRLYGGYDYCDSPSLSIIHSVKGRPHSPVKIYRAIPKETSYKEDIAEYEKQMKHILKTGKIPSYVNVNMNSSEYFTLIDKKVEELKNLPEKTQAITRKINAGDWVSICKQYAIEHGRIHLKNNYRILTKTVPAKHIYNSGDSLVEYGYDPS